MKFSNFNKHVPYERLSRKATSSSFYVTFWRYESFFTLAGTLVVKSPFKKACSFLIATAFTLGVFCLFSMYHSDPLIAAQSVTESAGGEGRGREVGMEGGGKQKRAPSHGGERL